VCDTAVLTTTVTSYFMILIVFQTLNVIYTNVSRMGERRDAYRALLGKPEGRGPLERPRRRWEDNIKMDIRGVGWGRGLD
jgi:hypothetical protein